MKRWFADEHDAVLFAHDESERRTVWLAFSDRNRQYYVTDRVVVDYLEKFNKGGGQ